MQVSNTAFSAALLLATLAMAGPAAAGVFDGTWIVSTQSNRSNCGGKTNEMTVADGKVSGQFVGNNGIYTARGSISDAGKIKFNLDSGYVVFKGKMGDGKGSGKWNAGHCAGKFTMIPK